MSGSVAPEHPGSVFMSVASETTESCVDDRRSGQIPESMAVSQGHTAAGNMLIWVSGAATWSLSDI